MLLFIPPAARTSRRAMGMSSEQSKPLRTCWKTLVILIWPYWHTGPPPFPGVACHLLNCWWGDKYGQTSHSSQKPWLPNGRFWRSLELQMNSLKTNRKQPSTHATKPKSFQIFQTIPMFGSPQVEVTHLGESSQPQILPGRTLLNPQMDKSAEIEHILMLCQKTRQLDLSIWKVLRHHKETQLWPDHTLAQTPLLLTASVSDYPRKGRCGITVNRL